MCTKEKDKEQTTNRNKTNKRKKNKTKNIIRTKKLKAISFN